MTKAEAQKLAARMVDYKPGVTFKAAPQDWRDGGHWYVKGSDGSGTFKARPAGGREGGA
jgi:hypothetical protein